MSVQAMSWVISKSLQKGSELLTLLMIANCANEDGSDAFPGIVRLAKDTRMSERQVRRIIKTLEASGELVVKHSVGRYSNRYSLPLMNPDNLSGLNNDKMSVSEKSDSDKSRSNPDISSANPDIAMASDPSLEPSIEPPLPARAREGDQAASPKARPLRTWEYQTSREFSCPELANDPDALLKQIRGGGR